VIWIAAMENLNSRRVSNELDNHDYTPPDVVQSENITVYFRDLESHLVEKINQYPVVVGCVAWLTNDSILDALATRERVSIVIQKEDFLRPDSGEWSGKKLRKKYGQLPPGVTLGQGEDWGILLNRLSYGSPCDAPPVNWMGNFNWDQSPSFPRMHNKFMVFCDIEVEVEDGEEMRDCFTPKAVWTGSFNMTHNATLSMENAVFITDNVIANSYYYQWQYILSLSEKIDNEYWHREWWFPDIPRIGS
jgi:hypothetical protein